MRAILLALLAALLATSALAQSEEAALPAAEAQAPAEVETTTTGPEAEAPKIIRVPEAERPRRRVRPRRAAAAPSEPPGDLPAAVTDEDIAVTSDYRGFRVTVFGVNPDRDNRGDIVVALRGPNAPTIVRRKRRVLGLWVNGPPVRFEEAPSFLAVYSARPLRQIASPQAVWTLQLDAAAAARLAGPTPPDADPSAYRQALVRLRRQIGLYTENPRGLRMLGRGLFRAQIQIPANAPIGQYTADVYLFRNGRLISSQTSRVLISRQGVERTIHDFATGQPFLYGLATVIFALGAGWTAAFFFRRA